MQKQKIIPVLFFLVFTLLLGACSVQTAPEVLDSDIVLIDDLGREVILDAPATSIVSLAPSNSEILFGIVAGNLLIGRDEYSDYPVEALEIESIGGGMNDFNLETITALNPDLVLAAEINAPEVIDALEKLDITVYYLGNPDNFAELYENIETVGILTGHEDEAETLAESLQARVETLLQLVAEDENIPTVFFELDASEPSKPWTTGSGTFVDYLISMAGAENIASDVED